MVDRFQHSLSSTTNNIEIPSVGIRGLCETHTQHLKHTLALPQFLPNSMDANWARDGEHMMLPRQLCSFHLTVTYGLLLTYLHPSTWPHLDRKPCHAVLHYIAVSDTVRQDQIWLEQFSTKSYNLLNLVFLTNFEHFQPIQANLAFDHFYPSLPSITTLLLYLMCQDYMFRKYL